MKYHSLLFLALFALQPTTSHFMTLEIKNVHHSNPRLNPASNHNNWLRKPQSSCTSHWTTQYYSLAYWLLNLSLFTWLFISQSSFRNKRVLVTRKASERDNEWGCRWGPKVAGLFPFIWFYFKSHCCVVWLQMKLGLSCYDLMPRQGLQSLRPTTVYYLRP